MSTDVPPEEAVVDAVLFDPLGAQVLLTAFVHSGPMPVGLGLLHDIFRKEAMAPDRMRTLLNALATAGLIRLEYDGYSLCIPPLDAIRCAAVLRGVAYAQHRHRDANQVEITLSPPVRPSRLMEVLPSKGFAWARLYDTKDSLIELASRARQRFVVVSPFLDDQGLDWIDLLFQATARSSVERILIVRGRDDSERDALRAHRAALASWKTRILTYAIVHDPELRIPVVETFHAKILLADNDKAYVGSANMTRWSRDFSMECGVILSGPCVRPIATLVDALASIAKPWVE